MRSNWKTPFFYYKLKKSAFKSNDKKTIYKIKDKNYRIFKFMVHKKFKVYTGNRYKGVYIKPRMRGHKIGELFTTRNRVYHLRRKREKALEKKKKEELKKMGKVKVVDKAKIAAAKRKRKSKK